MNDSLSPLALGDDALDLVQPAVGARGTMLYHIAPDLSSSTALAGLRRPTLHGTECLSWRDSSDGGGSLLASGGSSGSGSGSNSGSSGSSAGRENGHFIGRGRRKDGSGFSGSHDRRVQLVVAVAARRDDVYGTVQVF